MSTPSSSTQETLRGLLALLKALDHRGRKTVAEVVAGYLAVARRELVSRNYQNTRCVLEALARDLGALQVKDCTPARLAEWIDRNPRWASKWTRRRANAMVQRAMNWAAKGKLVARNPFKGLSYEEGDPGRAMTEEEFRALLRNTDAGFRRLLLALFWTGARPGELCVLRWEHIDWQRCVGVLPWDEHKTGRRTRRPRVIALTPPMMRLLAWLKRQRPAVPTAALLAGVLARGPLPLKEVVRRMQALGASYRAVYKARLRLGLNQAGSR
jgi:integrase